MFKVGAHFQNEATSPPSAAEIASSDAEIANSSPVAEIAISPAEVAAPVDASSHADGRNGDKWYKCMQEINARLVDIAKPYLANPYFRETKILFIDPSEHGNIGDTTMCFGTYKLLAKFGIDELQITRCSLAQSYSSARCTPALYASHRLAIWHGGGNWGDLWHSMHQSRMTSFKAIAASNATLLGFPQSYYYKNPSVEQSDTRHIRTNLFSGGASEESVRSRFVFMWRSARGFEAASKALPFATNLLTPDMAFAIGPQLSPLRLPMQRMVPKAVPQVDIVFIWRRDQEGRFAAQRNDATVRKWLDDMPGGIGKTVTFALLDWNAVTDGKALPWHKKGGRHWKYSNYEMLHAGVGQFLAAGRVVVTDRLHGSILSTLFFRPVVYLDNSYAKTTNTRAVALSSLNCEDKEALGARAATSMKEAVEIAAKWLPDLPRDVDAHERL